MLVVFDKIILLMAMFYEMERNRILDLIFKKQCQM
jgi:hypothetical protein